MNLAWREKWRRKCHKAHSRWIRPSDDVGNNEDEEEAVYHVSLNKPVREICKNDTSAHIEKHIIPMGKTAIEYLSTAISEIYYEVKQKFHPLKDLENLSLSLHRHQGSNF